MATPAQMCFLYIEIIFCLLDLLGSSVSTVSAAGGIIH